ncbi:MAG: hypothetical protein QF613_01165 [Candidatus Marinimicrobia bacterium]|nr:hypothetical protein [Candidatus Neomarinimicrobiota bacterium]MDP6456682.1 hypothetical protein [Candidatus Neomarinimicrobiota bacterium]MDP6592804.1 hypothetical protein [Candidatus Neomarinimicrobiota bacterium]MDP6837190.1 hypothetical protein [Candidatus Neomarinimicrobiota bacterium]MDP6965894.1 hypothetical protein [Candidatus Neomarinimicrobiota bacterium]
MKWNKQKFIKELQKEASREVVKVGERLCDFTESAADEASWGRGSEYGTLTYKSQSDHGLISLFQMTSRGQIKFQINNLRQKGVAKPILRDYLIKLESNFLRDYDEENYPIDSFEEIIELFTTSTQLDKFITCIEGVTYRLRQ